jgi:hypothetical protein
LGFYYSKNLKKKKKKKKKKNPNPSPKKPKKKKSNPQPTRPSRGSQWKARFRPAMGLLCTTVGWVCSAPLWVSAFFLPSPSFSFLSSLIEN